jgi:signal transduction histidine kinase
VADHGQGFESDYAETIFKPFRRLHGNNVPGSGIGLATCKRVVERLGGKIWAESTVGAGSRFHFTLPAEPTDV